MFSMIKTVSVCSQALQNYGIVKVPRGHFSLNFQVLNLTSDRLIPPTIIPLKNAAVHNEVEVVIPKVELLTDDWVFFVVVGARHVVFPHLASKFGHHHKQKVYFTELIEFNVYDFVVTCANSITIVAGMTHSKIFATLEVVIPNGELVRLSLERYQRSVNIKLSFGNRIPSTAYFNSRIR